MQRHDGGHLAGVGAVPDGQMPHAAGSGKGGTMQTGTSRYVRKDRIAARSPNGRHRRPMV